MTSTSVEGTINVEDTANLETGGLLDISQTGKEVTSGTSDMAASRLEAQRDSLNLLAGRSNVGSAMTGDTTAENIKQESDLEELQFVWTNLSREVIDLTSDNGAEVVLSGCPEKETEIISTTEAFSATPLIREPRTSIADADIMFGSADRSVPVLQAKGNLATKPKTTKVPWTAERRAKIEQIQRAMAEKAYGRPVPEKIDGLFSSNRNQTAAQGSNVTRPSALPASDGDPNAWMWEEVQDETDAALNFAELKEKYETKVRSKTNSWMDNIKFLRAEKGERARLKRLDIESQRAGGAPTSSENKDSDEEETLFVPEERPSKRKGQVLTDAGLSLASGDDNAAAPEKRRKVNPRGKRQEAALVREGMAAGAEAHEAKERKKRKKGKPESRTPKMKESRASKERKKSSKGRNSKASQPKTSKKKITKPTLFRDVNSLFSSNVYTEANQNLDKTLPVMDAKRKTEALQQLISSVPLEDARMASREKEFILKATITLGKRKVKPDGAGGWTFRGFRSSLRHHQVVGAAWMKTRETGIEKPLGGMCCDEMGFGKTITMLANCLANPPPAGDPCKTTLIVATPAISAQWEDEIRLHCLPGSLGRVVMYNSSSRLRGPDALAIMQEADVILTTYSEVLRSYPRRDQAPLELVSYEKQMEWWKQYYEAERGLIHRIKFYRVVLDEAQTIKNHNSRISIACRGLITQHAWLMSGTPLQDKITELYSYFCFLKVPYTGSFEIFKRNFLDKASGVGNDRLHSLLRQWMIRRTHADTFMQAPLITLPQNHEKTVEIEFNEVERTIYEIFRNRCIKRINSYQRANVLGKFYRNVLVLLLRLRQLTAHIFLVQEALEDLFEGEDIERLWSATTNELEATDPQTSNTTQNMLAAMKKMIADKSSGNRSTTASKANTPLSNGDEDPELEHSRPLVFRFRKFLRQLSQNSKFDDLVSRTLCHRCRDVPQDPHVTECLHLYCKECLNAMNLEAAADGEDHARCLDCGTTYAEARPCDGLKELGYNGLRAGSEESSRGGRRPKKDPEEDVKWMTMDGQVLQSAKTAAMVKQLEEWFEEDSTIKVLVFSQFTSMIKIIARVCSQRGWENSTYFGGMSHDLRAKTIREFRTSKEKKILIANLKCGGTGLNLTACSRVIIFDLFWNKATEQQAFCRVFRIGQEKETYITRFVVKNTVDEKLRDMQLDKQAAIDAAMGDDGARSASLTIQELLKFFGPVGEDEDGQAFIWPDNDDGLDSQGEREDAVPGHDPHAV